jgi:hypothetical protein
MDIWISLGILLFSLLVIFLSARKAKKGPLSNDVKIPDHIWDELKDAIPEADYNFLRTTSSYMGSSPSDTLSRLNYIGAIRNPANPTQVRITILELRLADQEREIFSLRRKIPNDVKVMWLSVSSVAGLSSLVAFVFFMLQQARLVQ